MALELNDLIQVYDDVLEKNQCEELINFYEKNSTNQERVDNSGVPTFTQLNLTEIGKDMKIHKDIVSKIFEYKKIYYDYICDECFPSNNTFEKIKIKKYETTGKDFFDTHVDVKDHASSKRYLSFLFYLNDVEEGGETIFKGLTIKPKIGRMIVFPPLWMYPHKGCVPISNEKYIMSSYLHYK
jgi:prolyl 4-hydroxylase